MEVILPQARATCRRLRAGPAVRPVGGRLHFADRGAIAQLGERLDRTQEVAGSSPASSIVVSSNVQAFLFDEGIRGIVRTGVLAQPLV
jgi:hypothetical protein